MAVDGGGAVAHGVAPVAAPGISFVATSNAAALRAAKVVGTSAPLHSVIETSRTFQVAFGADDGEPRQKKQSSSAREAPKPQIIQSSGAKETLVHPARWGLVSAFVEAYNGHHELVLRPDDVWQAILTQFSFYVNANSEALRDRFVDFKGKKTLVVLMGGTLFTADYAEFARRMVDENIVSSIKDPSVAAWLLPCFSTTTDSDRVAAAISVMSTLQSYFKYVCRLMCGIPKVTLLGDPADWKQLRAKVERLPEYDLADGRMTAWHKLLVPVLDAFVLSAEGSPSLEFWDCVCSRHGGGSGPSYLSGWVTVFACFSHKGEWQGNPFRRARDSWGVVAEEGAAPWPIIDFEDLPVGALSVPVLVDDNGTQYETQMLAGQFAFDGHGGEGVAIQPRTDWCMAYAGEAKSVPEAYRHGEIRDVK